MCEFRYYLDYHIKSSKTYLHGRMRDRAEQWKNCKRCLNGDDVVVIREAKIEEENVVRTTASGKTFKMFVVCCIYQFQ